MNWKQFFCVTLTIIISDIIQKHMKKSELFNKIFGDGYNTPLQSVMIL